MIDFQALNQELLSQAREWIPSLIPGGRFVGHEYTAASMRGGHGDSFKVNLETGAFCDFAHDEDRGTDLIALYARIKGLGMREAAIALGGKDQPNGANGSSYHAPPPARAPPVEILPMPEEPYCRDDFRTSAGEEPVAFWVYRSFANTPMFVVARYENEQGDKHILPWTWDGTRWQNKLVARPRPLFGLENLAPAGPVLVVEGEKTCVAAQAIFTDSCVSWPSGASAVRHADWEPVRGRDVTIWPDNDVPGIQAASTLAGILLQMGCQVALVITDDLPEHWDLADSIDLDLHAYRRTHLHRVPGPEEPQEPRLTAPAPEVAPLQTSPAAGTTTLAAPAASGSLDEMYQRYNFTLKTNGRPHSSEYNVGCALQARSFGVYYDEFRRRVCHPDDTEWTDADTRALQAMLQKQVELYEISYRTVQTGLLNYANSRRRNPLTEWLRSITWDGKGRLDDLMHRGFGAEYSDYTKAVSRCFGLAMVARVLRPGCKHDCMLVLQGDQGISKSRGLEALAGENYFAEIHDSICSKDFSISMIGKWLCDVNELHAFKTAEIERIKGVISTKIDRYRDPYGSTATDHPRSSVLSGTTNRDDWNTDETGARRFWPIDCGRINLAWIRDHREQLFAEAVARYDAGEDWWEIANDERAEEMREGSRDIDPWEDVLREYLAHHVEVRIPHLMSEVIGIKAPLMDLIGQKRIGKILRRFGYRKDRRTGETRHWTRAPRPSVR
jgi:putative DNA primase/helicase